MKHCVILPIRMRKITRHRHRWNFILLPLLCLSFTVSAEQSQWKYTDGGLSLKNDDSGSYLTLGLRMQARYSTIEEEPRVSEDLTEAFKSGTDINRARYKIWAGLRRDFTFYHEYDLRNSKLLDLRTTWISKPNFKFRVGQWKPEFNRERVDSSGKQQFSERSIATYWFTIDRQWGAVASGRVSPGKVMDSSWWTGVLGGNGRSQKSDGGRPMGLARWQWNYSGEVLPFSQSALKRYAVPRGSFALAMISNDSKYTRYSSDGGGQLPGYSEGEDNQYRILQGMQEWAWQGGGLSFQQELHWKSVRDKRYGGTRNLLGGYAQMGWFPAQRWHSLSPKLEFAFRAAYVNPDDELNTENGELTLGGNWFFNGHRNKLTLDMSYLTIEEQGVQKSDSRFRIQWDVSL
jgi:phosphate-selective porin OprO/OprP